MKKATKKKKTSKTITKKSVKKKEKICLVTSFYPPYHVGGACTHVYYVANLLAEQGHEVHVIYSIDSFKLIRPGKEPTKGWVNHKLVNLHPVKSHIGKISPVMGFATGLPLGYESIQTILDKINPDVVHYHNISLFGPKIFQLKTKAIKLFTSHDFWYECGQSNLYRDGKICDKKICSRCLVKTKKPPQLWRQTSLMQDSLNQLDLIISPSVFLKNKFKKQLDEWNIKVPITTLSNFLPEPHKIAKNKKQKKEGFAFVGQLTEAKGIKVLAESFNSEEIKEPLYVAGTGPLEEWLKKYIKENNLEKKIIMLGFINNEEIIKILYKIKGLILSSVWYENQPMVLIEGLSVGTPIIGTDLGGITEIIEKVDKRLLYKDVKGLREIVKNIDKISKSTSLKENNLKKQYKKYYSPENYVKEYNKILTAVEELK